jgi:hypothetical protein
MPIKCELRMRENAEKREDNFSEKEKKKKVREFLQESKKNTSVVFF